VDERRQGWVKEGPLHREKYLLGERKRQNPGGKIMTEHPETQLIKHYENSQDFSQKGKLDENKGVKIANKNSQNMEINCIRPVFNCR